MKLELPRAFVELSEAGRFDYWGAPYASLTDAQREELVRVRRHEVLWFQAVEWDRTPAQIRSSPEREDMLPGLVAFAGNGHGDQYAWYLPWQDGPEPPVLFCPHDEEEATCFAPDFASCLERLWLLHGAHAEPEEGDDLPADLAAWLEILRPYLPAPRARKLAALLEEPIATAFEEEEQARGEAFTRGRRPLEGPNLKSTEYLVEYLGKDALRLYDDSIAFYERLVAEGHARFEEQLGETRRNRAKAVDELARGR